ncbi:MAG: glycoside hydrolase/phage tail family protein [Rhodobacteraceae bacterium]|nr:glycoside hydrolase/phage tail family protein [Paracoccaceae bacterium]
MATLVLSAAGAALGSGFGGAVLGLSGAVIGQAVGATLGMAIDRRAMAGGTRRVEGARLDRLRVTAAGEGAPVARVWGRVRLGGHVIWATRFMERREVQRFGGGKSGPRTEVTDYSYAVSMAVALCEGPILGVGRIWADGAEIAPGDLTLRVYLGDEAQMPDPLIAAVEGGARAPAYRGIAYVVIEDLDLGRFGNRVPQFAFEVLRAAAPGRDDPDLAGLHALVEAVALMPGTGDYALATTPVSLDAGAGAVISANINTPQARADIDVALDALSTELPRCGSVLLVVSWFGDDLRAGRCTVQPKVAFPAPEGDEMAWSVSGRGRAEVPLIPQLEGRPVYGSTPADASVIEAIAALGARGQKAVFYPFLLMDQMAGNGLPDPWSEAGDQPVLPWRGRITLEAAPGRPGSPDGTAAAAAEVAAFFGTAAPEHFQIAPGQVGYTGPAEWSYRRFILHCAALCAAAGGVDAFCIGSEMRSLTQIRGPGGSFPAVVALRALAADVRAILGPQVKLTYAADWSEYFGYISPEGDRFFHLDPLWADPEIDFIGIDNYMPLSDWRDGAGHADADWGSIYNPDYLRANVAGGEGFDWFYPTDQARRVQAREPITDGAHDEPWIWRYKDLRSWWENAHHDRVGGVRAPSPSPWAPRSKPIWFTELGCAAIDKGTNQPNKFLDPKSSESSLPYFSTGRRDDVIQMQYLRAMVSYWSDPAHNPVSDVYDGLMVDMTRAHVWAWDARPFPWFPANRALWSDGENWARGHWLSGRATGQPLAAVVAEICRRAGLEDVDVSALYGVVRGYAALSTDSARAMLEPLMLAHGIEAEEVGGRLVFRLRDGTETGAVRRDTLVVRAGGDLERVRAPQAEAPGRMQIAYTEAEADFDTKLVEARLPDATEDVLARTDPGLTLTRAEARALAERLLAEARAARDTARFDLPPSQVGVGPGSVLRIVEDGGSAGLWRVTRMVHGAARAIEAVRADPALHRPTDPVEEGAVMAPFVPPVPVQALFADLPLIRGTEVPHAPHVAVAARPWPGAVAVYEGPLGAPVALNTLIAAPAGVGESETPLAAAPPGRWDRGPALRVRLAGRALASVSAGEVMAGANLMAIGDGAVWEVFQFAEAELVGPDLWDITLRLRGQAGSDGVMPAQWPAGSRVIVLDDALRQITLPLEARGLARRYRVGPAGRPVTDPSFRESTRAFDGVGLRPYAPAHLRLHPLPGGDLRVAWVRRTRIGGDSWAGAEVPLAEEAERYRLRVFDGGGALRRTVEVATPEWVYPATLRAGDGTGPGQAFSVAVAQVSALFGPGPETVRDDAG